MQNKNNYINFCFVALNPSLNLSPERGETFSYGIRQSNKELKALPFQGRAKPLPQVEVGRGFYAMSDRNFVGEYRYGFNSMEKDDEIKGTGNSYDFGARLYDPRVGRWLAVDKMQKEFPNESGFIFAGNSPLIFIDINGLFKFIIDESAKSKHPELSVQRFENVLKNLESYLLNNPDLIQELHKNTGLPIEEIKQMIKYGEGPGIRLVNRGDVIVGLVSPESFKAGEIWIDIDQAIALEQAMDRVLPDYAMMIVGLILHEFTHFGDRKTNKGWLTGEQVGGDPNWRGGEIKTDTKANQTNREGEQKRKKSISGERGVDMESYFFFGRCTEDAAARVPLTDKDGKLDGKNMDQLRKSKRYKSDKDKMIPLTQEPKSK